MKDGEATHYVVFVSIILTTMTTTSPTTSTATTTATATVIPTIRRRSSSMTRRSLNSIVALMLLKWFIVVHLKPWWEIKAIRCLKSWKMSKNGSAMDTWMERLTRTLRMMLNWLIRAGTRC
ncbi:hypothetical protein DL95DRAFT_392914 [Leptodontidium sp. 2 PMI_412]|nr:hypothetical protein DL95DRAFT_392914 [Leptodontidium sp. 2 PMI_412]